MPFMEDLEHATDNFLKSFIPDVYQENIYAIDYGKLKEKGIKLITFDVDDTIIPKKIPMNKRRRDYIRKATILFTELKQSFRVMLVSNSKDEEKVRRLADELGAERYVARAEKPNPKYFEEIRDYCNLKVDQMAHVGNSIRNDVGCGNSIHITTCLVRPVAHEEEIAPELKKRKLWHKHHREEKGDQYYQLGETQKPWR